MPAHESLRVSIGGPLARRFFAPSAETVARALLGKLLVRRMGGLVLAGIIVETEAYLVGDPASHGFKGQTARNASMFGPAGRAYVYQTRHHFCFNAVCQPRGRAEAVLVRALEPVLGFEEIARRRAGAEFRRWTSGPANLCAAFAIDRSLDGVDLTSEEGPLVLAHVDAVEDVRARLGPVAVATRIGISRGAERPLRFLLLGSECISRRPSTRRRDARPTDSRI